MDILRPFSGWEFFKAHLGGERWISLNVAQRSSDWCRGSACGVAVWPWDYIPAGLTGESSLFKLQSLLLIVMPHGTHHLTWCLQILICKTRIIRWTSEWFWRLNNICERACYRAKSRLSVNKSYFLPLIMDDLKFSFLSILKQVYNTVWMKYIGLYHEYHSWYYLMRIFVIFSSEEFWWIFHVLLCFYPFSVAMRSPCVAALGLYLGTLVILLIFPLNVFDTIYAKAVGSLVLHFHRKLLSLSAHLLICRMGWKQHLLYRVCVCSHWDTTC